MKQGCENIQYSFLNDYFQGEPSSEKKEKIASWFEDPDHHIKLERCLKELWKETDPDKINSPTGFDNLLHQIHHKINLLQLTKLYHQHRRIETKIITFNSVFKILARIAAILLLPVMIYLGWEFLSQRMWEKSQAEVIYNEIICPLGTRSRFTLPDGTSGWLNNGSRLKYPVKFFGNYREVDLVGEAYFDVIHQKNRPFIIYTNGLDVKVLGTSLNVQSYPDESFQTFTLMSGSAELFQLQNGEQVSILKMEPGQHAVYSTNVNQEAPFILNMNNIDQRKTLIVGKQKKIQPSKINFAVTSKRVDTQDGKIEVGLCNETTRYTEWTEGKLVLRNDPMPLMLKRIERWYNVEFNITDERIKEYSYWATFQEENLDQVLKMLSLTGPVKFVMKSREQTLDGSFTPQLIDVILIN